ncbi:hypothetical protein D6C99_01032 [Aureobasidium pullulans]|nr:hypothetical protein D6C99_01032 [Aureobasidium pullulans]
MLSARRWVVLSNQNNHNNHNNAPDLNFRHQQLFCVECKSSFTFINPTIAMSRDSYKPQRFTTNPFTLPVRPSYSWEDSRDRTSEQLHESAMRQFGLPQGTSVSTSVAASNESPEAAYQKWENRGLLIQKHERRLSDSNNLLAKMWRRLDPYGRVGDVLSNNVVVQRHAEQRAEPAYSENPYMQGLFHQLAAYDYINAVDPEFILSPVAPTAAAASDTGLTEKRLNSLATTVKMQSGLVQEKNETIEKLRAQLAAQRKVQLQFTAHQKDKDDTISLLEKQVQKASARISALCNTLSETKPKSIAAPRAPRSSRAPRTARTVRAPRAPSPKLPEDAFGGIPENHASLTFNGFSEHNAFNPARLQMLTSVNPPVSNFQVPNVKPGDDIFDVGPLSSGANRAPLGPIKRRYDSAMQSSHGSRTATPLPAWSPHAGLPRRAIEQQRDAVLLDYDDPEEVPKDCISNKRFKSGVLTPPRPEDLVMKSVQEPTVKVEDAELEMGEIKEVPEVGSEHKYVYDGLEEMIQEAQKSAKA